MKFLIGLFILIVLYAAFKIYRAGRGNTIRKHGHCCDECAVREECQEYRKNKYND